MRDHSNKQQHPAEAQCIQSAKLNRRDTEKKALPAKEKETDMPKRSVISAVQYTLGKIKQGKRFASTEEVFQDLDKEFGWK